MSNHGNYIVSLGNVCRWLAAQAEALGVEIYPGFPAADIAYDENGAVKGVITGDLGVARDGHHKDHYTPGMALLGKYTLFAEGARGSLSKQLIAKFDLDAASDPQKFGIGLKELWEIARSNTNAVWCCTRWAGRSTTAPAAARSCIISAKTLCSIGFVVHLNYSNPYLSPFDEFQRVEDASGASARSSKAASAFPMARARSPKAGCNRCRSSSFPAAR